VTATFYYNLSLAHLQRFEYQPAQEARSQADRLAAGLTRSYDSLWKYAAVCRRGQRPTRTTCGRSLRGDAAGSAKNVAGRGTHAPARRW
jgi:hypothetical protein